MLCLGMVAFQLLVQESQPTVQRLQVLGAEWEQMEQCVGVAVHLQGQCLHHITDFMHALSLLFQLQMDV